MVTRFHGRDAELSLLEDLSRRADTERLPTGANVIGDPGTGKSRLLDEAASRSPIRHAIRLSGFEPEAGIGLAAARELRPLGGEGVRILGAVADEAGPGAQEVAAEVAELAMEVGEYGVALTRWVDVVSGAPDPGTRAQAALGASRAAYELERLDEAQIATLGSSPLAEAHVRSASSQISGTTRQPRDGFPTDSPPSASEIWRSQLRVMMPGPDHVVMAQLARANERRAS